MCCRWWHGGLWRAWCGDTGRSGRCSPASASSSAPASPCWGWGGRGLSRLAPPCRCRTSCCETSGTVSAYLDIEKLRFGDRLQVEQHVDPVVLDAPVPPFLIQPLVENAVRHGAQAERERGVANGLVQLEVRPQGDIIVIRVGDNGP